MQRKDKRNIRKNASCDNLMLNNPHLKDNKGDSKYDCFLLTQPEKPRNNNFFI